MRNTFEKTKPHPQFMAMLFAHQARVSSVFNDVLGLHGLKHMAIAQIDSEQNILVFSSKPSLEFNLFVSGLWKMDKTYHPDWYRQNSFAFWETLYADAYYDELYYECQIRHHLPLGFSVAAKTHEHHYIYSLGFDALKTETFEEIHENTEDFQNMGRYCQQLLEPCFRNIV